MIQTLLYCLIFIVTLLIIVTLHELGHFWVARYLGVKTLRFSFGFGKPLWRHIGRDGTEYVVCWLPLGGYVKLLDTREKPVPDEERAKAFDLQPIWKRLMILLAGPAMNFLLGFIAFASVFMLGVPRVTPIIGEVITSSIASTAQVPVGAEIKMVDGQPVDNWQKIGMALVSRLGDSGYLALTVSKPGEPTTQTLLQLPLEKWSVNALSPDPLKSLGLMPYFPAQSTPSIIASILPNSAAAKAGLQVGDHIVSVNEQPTKSWFDLVQTVSKLPGKTVPIDIERDGHKFSTQITLDTHSSLFHTVGKIGASVQPQAWPADKRYIYQLSPFMAMQEAAQEVWDITKFNLVVVEKILSGKISLFSLSGPISIFQTTSIAFQEGVVIYIAFLGLLSVAIGVMNLLPIPGLDGGQVIFCLLEGIIRRPISLRWQVLLWRIGIICLIMLMVQATVNDILRLFL